MGTMLCKDHQGNPPHYAKENCEICRLTAEVKRLAAERHEAWTKHSASGLRYQLLRAENSKLRGSLIKIITDGVSKTDMGTLNYALHNQLIAARDEVKALGGKIDHYRRLITECLGHIDLLEEKLLMANKSDEQFYEESLKFGERVAKEIT